MKHELPIEDCTVETQEGEVLICLPGITWHGRTAVTDDGYVVEVGVVQWPVRVVIRVTPPWHKPFHVSFQTQAADSFDASGAAGRLIASHRKLHGRPPKPTHLCAREH